MMAGVLIASIASGNVISKTGRYKPFPIIGTAVAALAMLLLSRLAVSTPLWLAALYLLVLGLGLGLVMQVLVLAAQNAVPYKMLGVATSGSTLFRQIGGAVGVSIFGAIFANRLATELAERIPAGVHVPAAANPALVHHLPEAVKQPFIEAFTAAITPIFLAAGGFAIAAFLLTWLLREVPLRETSATEGIGESFAAPHDDRSDRELERILSSITSGRMRTETYQRIVDESRVELTPAEAWLLGRLATSGTLEHRQTKADDAGGGRRAHRRAAPPRLPHDRARKRPSRAERAGPTGVCRARRSGPRPCSPASLPTSTPPRRRSPTSCAASRSHSWPTSQETPPASRAQRVCPPPHPPDKGRRETCRRPATRPFSQSGV